MEMSGKRVGFLAVVCTLVLLLIVGCESRVKKEEGKKEIVLKTVSMFGGTTPGAKVYQDINEKFMKEHENVTIEDDSQICDEEWKTKVAVSFAVGNEPDVIQFFTDSAGESILSTNKLISLEEIRKEYPEYAEDTLDIALEAVRNKDGVLRAVPTTGYWEGLFCNKELFAKYHVKLPTDWDSFVKAVRIFKKNGVVPVAVSLEHMPHYWIEHLLLYTAGEEEYVNIPEKAPKTWIKAFDTLKELRDMGAFPEDTDVFTDNCAIQLFQEGKAAMQLEGSWYVGSLAEAGMTDKVTVVAFPGVREQKAQKGALITGISTGFYITKRAWDNPEKRELAVRFVEAHTTKKSLERYWSGNGIATFKGSTDKGLTSIVEAGKTLSDGATSLNTPTDSRICPEAYQKIIEGAVDVSAGRKDAETLLNEALQLEKDRK